MIIYFKDKSIALFLGQNTWEYLKNRPYMPGTKPPNLLGKLAYVSQSQKQNYPVSY